LMINSTLDVLKNSISSSTFPQSTIDSYILTFETDLVNLKTLSSQITQAKQAIQEQKTLLNYKIKTQNDIINSLSLELNLAKNNLDKINLNSSNSIQDAKFKLDLAINEFNNIQTKTQNNIDQAKSQIKISEASLDYKKDPLSDKELAPSYKSIENARK